MVDARSGHGREGRPPSAPRADRPRDPEPRSRAADPSIADLRHALTSPDPLARADAIHRSEPLPAAEAALLSALDDSDPRVRHAAVRALARLARPEAVRGLIRASGGDPSRGVRREAVVALGRILSARPGRPAEGLEPGTSDP